MNNNRHLLFLLANLAVLIIIVFCMYEIATSTVNKIQDEWLKNIVSDIWNWNNTWNKQ